VAALSLLDELELTYEELLYVKVVGHKDRPSIEYD